MCQQLLADVMMPISQVEGTLFFFQRFHLFLPAEFEVQENLVSYFLVNIHGPWDRAFLCFSQFIRFMIWHGCYYGY